MSTMRISRISMSAALAIGLAAIATGCLPGEVPAAGAATVPLWVVAQDSVMVTPFSTSRSVHNLGGGTPATFTVPSSGRLVIRFVSASCSSTNGVPFDMLRVTTDVDHFFAPQYSRHDPASNNRSASLSHEALVFAAAGSTVQLMAFPTTNPQRTSCNVSLAGYLVEE